MEENDGCESCKYCQQMLTYLFLIVLVIYRLLSFPFCTHKPSLGVEVSCIVHRINIPDFLVDNHENMTLSQLAITISLAYHLRY